MFPVGSCSSASSDEEEDIWILQNPDNMPFLSCQQQQPYVQKALVPRSRIHGLAQPTSASGAAFPVVHRTRTASAETGNGASYASTSVNRRAKYRSVIPACGGNSTFDSDLELDLERFACSEPVAAGDVRVGGASSGSTRDGSTRDRSEKRSRHREPKVPRNISCSSSGSEEDGLPTGTGVSGPGIGPSRLLSEARNDKRVGRNFTGFGLGSCQTAQLGTGNSETWNRGTWKSGTLDCIAAQFGTTEPAKNALATVALEPNSPDLWNRTLGKQSVIQISEPSGFDAGTSGTNRFATGTPGSATFGTEVTGSGSTREHRIKTTTSGRHLGFPLPLSSPDETRFESLRLNGQSGRDGLAEECSSPSRKSLGSTSDQADQEKIVSVIIRFWIRIQISIETAFAYE